MVVSLLDEHIFRALFTGLLSQQTSKKCFLLFSIMFIFFDQFENNIVINNVHIYYNLTLF